MVDGSSRRALLNAEPHIPVRLVLTLRHAGRVPLPDAHRLDRLVRTDPRQVDLSRRYGGVAERVAHDVREPEAAQ